MQGSCSRMMARCVSMSMAMAMTSRSDRDKLGSNSLNNVMRLRPNGVMMMRPCRMVIRRGVNVVMKCFFRHCFDKRTCLTSKCIER